MTDLEHIIKLVEEGRNIFVTGGGGVGKSYTLEKLKERFPGLVLTATTGVAAVNISGETIHRWSGARLFSVPIAQQATIIRRMPATYTDILECQMLAIDEVSMLASYQLDYLDGLFRSLRWADKPFGGIQLLLFGDLFQLPPVKRGSYATIDTKQHLIDYCFKAKCWDSFNFEIVNLTKVYRQKDAQFIDILNSIREGKPKNLELFAKNTGATAPVDATRLYTINARVESWNKYQYDKLESPEVIYIARDRFIKGNTAVDPWSPDARLTPRQESMFIEFNKYCKATQIVKLKEGTRVMLLNNLSVARGLCNGACGYVLELNPASVLVEFDNGVVEEIEYTVFQYHNKGKVVIERQQIPLMLAYAITIHKSQGMSIDKLAIDFDSTFECGQAYVALSRATNLDTLYIQNFNRNVIRVDNEIVQFYNKIRTSSQVAKTEACKASISSSTMPSSYSIETKEEIRQ